LSTSPLPVIIAKLVGTNPFFWWMLHAILIVIFTNTAFRIFKKTFPKSAHLAGITILISPTFLIVTFLIGQYDLYTVSGAFLAVFAERKVVRIIGVLMTVLTNPEQAIVASLLLIGLSLFVLERKFFNLAITDVLSSVSVFMAIRLFQSPTPQATRANIIGNEFRGSLESSLGTWNWIFLGIVGASGATLLLASWKILGTKMSLRSMVILFFIPALFSFAISDKSRVGVAISALALFAFMHTLFIEIQKESYSNLRNELLGLSTILLLIMPGIYVDRFGEIRLPYLELISRLTS